MSLIRHRLPVLLLASLSTATAWAQASRAEGDPPPQDPTQILSDVQPLPAEDRESTGVLMDASRMRAHEDTAANQPPDNALKPIVDRASGLLERTRSWDDVRDAASTQEPAGEASGAPRDTTQP